MDQAWKSINRFTVSFTSSFEQLKTYVYTKIKNNRVFIVENCRSPYIEKDYRPLLNVSVYRGGQVDRDANF